MSEESFDSLIRRVQAGQEDAAGEFMRRYAPHVRRIANVLLYGQPVYRVVESDDICQSVMVRFFQAAAAGRLHLETSEQLLKLLRTMTRNHVIKKKSRWYAMRRDMRRVVADDAAGELADSGSTPSMCVAKDELVAKARAVLSEDEQRLLEDRMSGRPWAEIASELGVEVDCVRKRLTRALERVTKELGTLES